MQIRIKKEVLRAGELIFHGDQLTNERFDSCKRLAQVLLNVSSSCLSSNLALST